MMTIYLSLVLAGFLYAVFLDWDPIYSRYFPDWIVLAVIGGVGIVLCGVYALEQITTLTTLDVFLSHLSVGGPIFVWQVNVRGRRKKKREEVMNRRRRS